MQIPSTHNIEDFFFTAITWHEVSAKIVSTNLDLIRQSLNQNISLRSYGTGVHEIAYIFVAIRPTNTLHGEMMRYYKAKKEVFIQKKLPFELVEAYTESEVLSLMANTYLQSLEDLTKRKISDFDIKQLHTDVQQLFQTKGWLNVVETPAATFA